VAGRTRRRAGGALRAADGHVRARGPVHSGFRLHQRTECGDFRLGKRGAMGYAPPSYMRVWPAYGSNRICPGRPKAVCRGAFRDNR